MVTITVLQLQRYNQEVPFRRMGDGFNNEQKHGVSTGAGAETGKGGGGRGGGRESLGWSNIGMPRNGGGRKGVAGLVFSEI